MKALEVGHLWLVASLDEGFETRLHQCAGAAAEDGLLAEKISLSLFLKRRLEHAGAGRANALGPSERGLLGGLGLVLRDRNQRRHTFALGIETADHMAGALRRDHNAVDILVQFDQAEVHRETVRENDGLALGEVREDVALIDRCLLHVRQADHNDIGEANRLRRIKNREAMLLRYGAGLRTRIEADDDLAAAVLQIERMGVALRTIAEDGERFVFEHAEIGVFVGVDFSGHDEISMRVLWASISERNLALESEATGASEFDNPEWLKQTQ